MWQKIIRNNIGRFKRLPREQSLRSWLIYPKKNIFSQKVFVISELIVFLCTILV